MTQQLDTRQIMRERSAGRSIRTISEHDQEDDHRDSPIEPNREEDERNDDIDDGRNDVKHDQLGRSKPHVSQFWRGMSDFNE